jgi:hypothetical protein
LASGSREEGGGGGLGIGTQNARQIGQSKGGGGGASTTHMHASAQLLPSSPAHTMYVGSSRGVVNEWLKTCGSGTAEPENDKSGAVWLEKCGSGAVAAHVGVDEQQGCSGEGLNQGEQEARDS